jgi:hypothetical protein
MPGATAGAQCLTMTSPRSDPDDNLAEIASVEHPMKASAARKTVDDSPYIWKGLPENTKPQLEDVNSSRWL